MYCSAPFWLTFWSFSISGGYLIWFSRLFQITYNNSSCAFIATWLQFLKCFAAVLSTLCSTEAPVFAAFADEKVQKNPDTQGRTGAIETWNKAIYQFVTLRKELETWKETILLFIYLFIYLWHVHNVTRLALNLLCFNIFGLEICFQALAFRISLLSSKRKAPINQHNYWDHSWSIH